MDDRELVALITAQRRESLGVDDGELSNERAEAYDRYHGRPYGNEVKGRSSVVSKDLAEAVDWCMPAIMKVFTKSGSVVEFMPVGEEDEELAKQETDYTNHEVMQKNPGWLVLFDAIKDALILKNGYVKHYWAVEEEIREESYTGLTWEAFQLLENNLSIGNKEVEIIGQEVVLDEATGIELIDVELKIKEKKGRLVVEAVPAEEIRVSNRCKGSLQDSPFTEHVTKKYRSDLIEMGMDAEFVNSLAAYTDDSDTDTESNARDSVSDESEYETTSYTDRSMDEIEYCEAYLRVDYDGDGIAELRKVVTVANQLPEGDEWNEVIESVSLTSFQAKRIPHRHVGESLNDDLEDIAEIKTTLTRQLLDNIYRTNDNQWVVNERVNIEDFLQSLPGGIKRVEGMEPVNGSVMPVQTTPIINHLLPAIGYIDDVKESRTGVSRASTGLNPDILQNTTKGAYIENLNRASQKVEMMIRLLAETGVKELIRECHNILVRHQDFKSVVKLRGKYVPIDPTSWRERKDLIVKVGIGSGTEEEKRQKMMIISELQDKLLPQGLIGPEQSKAMFDEISDSLGLVNPDKYAMAPGSDSHLKYLEYRAKMAQQQQQTNMLADAEKVKGMFEIEKTKFSMQIKAMQERHDNELELLKLEQKAFNEQEQRNFEAQLEKAKLESKEAIEAMKAEVQLFIEGTKADLGPEGFGTLPNAE